MSGWIKLHRDLMTKALWQAMPVEQSVVAIVLLMMVSHKDKTWLWKGEKRKLKPGQIITSLDGIIKNCPKNVSKQNVRTALKNLEKLEFLTDESTHGGRLITVLNWAIYQGDDESLTPKLTDDQQTTNRQLTDDQQTTNTNQELKNLRIKELKNEKNKKHNVATPCDDLKFASSFEHPVFGLTKHLCNRMLKNNPKAKAPEPETKAFDKWAIEIDRLNRLDGYSYAEIKALIDFSQDNDFWRSNILSGSKLRQKANTLKLQMDSKGSPNKGRYDTQMERMADW